MKNESSRDLFEILFFFDKKRLIVIYKAIFAHY